MISRQIIGQPACKASTAEVSRLIGFLWAHPFIAALHGRGMQSAATFL
jgi:hypothetical protein